MDRRAHLLRKSGALAVHRLALTKDLWPLFDDVIMEVAAPLVEPLRRLEAHGVACTAAHSGRADHRPVGCDRFVVNVPHEFGMLERTKYADGRGGALAKFADTAWPRRFCGHSPVALLFSTQHPQMAPDLLLLGTAQQLNLRLADLPSYRDWNAADPDSLLRLVVDVRQKYQVRGTASHRLPW